MKILVYSSTFYPKVGGIENVMLNLALQWCEFGHKVIVVTDTKEISDYDERLSVIRNWSPKLLLQLLNDVDVFIESCISLKTAWISLKYYKKWFVVHHTYYQHGNLVFGFIKNLLTYFSKNIFVSEYVASRMYGHGVVIHNFYNDVFINSKGLRVNHSIIFIGRLVSDKGCLLLLEAFSRLPNRFSLTVVGDGPELSRLKAYTAKYDLSNRVSFEGVLLGDKLVQKLNTHQIIAVPSLWDEPFGLVAQEGVLCGCVPVYANKGGLKEAVKGCGLSCQIDTPDKFSDALMYAYENLALYQDEVEVAGIKIREERSLECIANKYLKIFHESI